MSALMLAVGVALGAAWVFTGWSIFLAFAGPLLVLGALTCVARIVFATANTARRGRHRG